MLTKSVCTPVKKKNKKISANEKNKFITTTAGLEPARAKPKRFLIFLLNHSDKLPVCWNFITYTFTNQMSKYIYLFPVIVTIFISISNTT